jgi:hypothetical protein
MPNRQPRQKTFSGREWDGSFRPVAYALSNAAWNLPVQEVLSGGSVMATTVRDAFVGVCFEPAQPDATPGTFGPPRTLREVEDFLELNVRADSGNRVFKGESFPREILAAILRLHMAGAHPGYAAWFYYDTDSCMGDQHRIYEFFVVAYPSERIVLESVSFSDSNYSGFDPAAFAAGDEPDPERASTWVNEEKHQEALSLFWYRKFYSETVTGQIMALRPDKPEPFGWPRQTSPSDNATAALLARNLGLLSRIRAALWVLVALAILALIHFWR